MGIERAIACLYEMQAEAACHDTSAELAEARIAIVAELSRLRAEVATLRQERDTLIEKFTDTSLWVAKDVDGWIARKHPLKPVRFSTYPEAVLYVVGLPERGSDG